MRSESMARMPKGARPKSWPACISASKMTFWYSMPWWDLEAEFADEVQTQKFCRCAAPRWHRGP